MKRSSLVLVVDADVAVHETLRETLGGAGYHVISTTSTREAMELLHSGPTDVLVADYRLLSDAGALVLTDIQQHHGDLLCFLLADKSELESALDMIGKPGCEGVFRKPLQGSDLLIGLGEALQRRDLLREARAYRASTWDGIAAVTAATIGSRPKTADLGGATGHLDVDELTALMAEVREGRGGVVSARLHAAELGAVYMAAGTRGRRKFLRLLAKEMRVDRGALDGAIAVYDAARSENEKHDAIKGLRQALVAPRLRLLTSFNSLPDGVKFLVDLRADLLAIVDEAPELRALDDDLRQLLTSWFDPGFLDMRQITWESPAALLEKLIAYEAVHEIRSWRDLRHRLGAFGRCFALFHPKMPAEPLVFLEVALADGMAGSVQTILDERAQHGDVGRATTAVFYSISNTQRGLRGIGFGDVLIRRVVESLSRELPNLDTFVTLSPLPDFRRWLDDRAGAEVIAAVFPPDRLERLRRMVGEDDPALALKLAVTRPAWHRDPRFTELLEAPLTRLCLFYLLDRRPGGEPFDRVARFHLRNGARLERINWLGDTSQHGLRQSLGLMVNYRYVLADLEKNHERYAADHEVILGTALRAETTELGEAVP